MINSLCSGEINFGDLIYISPCYFGFYIGRGHGNSIQFYNIYELENLYLKNKKIRIRYIYGRRSEMRVVKYSPELFNEELKETYNNAIKGLELLK